jgi:DNA end-binding protein Ku
MAARAIWKGELEVGSLTVPVKIYSAVQDRDVHFHVVEGKTKARAKQQMVTEDQQAVAREEIRKGYEVEPGTFVILEKQDLDELKPQESRRIELSRFVPPSALDNAWYERPYYLGPDGESDMYFALAKALANQDAVGIAHWSMRGKAYVGALRHESDYLALIKLRYTEEILALKDLPAPGGRDLAQNELRMAEQLVEALEGTFDPKEFRDEYRERLQEFLAAKAKGRHPRLPAIKERKSAVSLDQQLAKSLAAMKKIKEKKVA